MDEKPMGSSTEEVVYDPPMEGFERLFVPNFYVYKGLIFVDLGTRDFDDIVAEILTHTDVRTAQSYMNVCLIESWLDKIIGENWDFDDARANAILDAIILFWAKKLMMLHPEVNAKVVKCIDDEYGDFGLTILNEFQPDEKET
jgi:hypothetical protein